MEFVLTLLCVLMISSAQILWKLGVTPAVAGTGPGPSTLPATLLRLATSVHMLAGAALYVIATGVWLLVLARKPVTLVYPLMALSYVVGAFLAIWLLKERVSVQQWIGIAVIMGGVTVFATAR